MKMIIAIINDYDTDSVLGAMREKEINVTKIASTGGFLMKGNAVLLSGVEESRLDEALNIIRENAKRRPKLVQPDYRSNFSSGPVETVIGGATIFVTDIEKFERV